MKILSWGKDGGPESTVHGFSFIEIKSLFTIVLLKFDGKSREAYHTHAFNSISWLFKGHLRETFYEFCPKMGWELSSKIKEHRLSLLPILTYRNTFHKVDSAGTSWVLSFRGPWDKEWKEYIPNSNKEVTLTNGRIEK